MRKLFFAVAMSGAMATIGLGQQKPAGSGTTESETKAQAIKDAENKASAKGAAADTKGAGGNGKTVNLDPLSPSVVNPSPASTIDPADRNLSPEELRKKYKDRLGKAYVDYSATCKPARIAPGKSGTLAVMMLLKQDAVMPPSGPTKIDFHPFQGKLALGTPQMQPARQARLADAFRGKVAFDDYAILDIPVTVAADAKDGAHPVQLRLSYELYQGKSGGWIERFLDNVEVEVLVGSIPATPVVLTAPTDDSAQGSLPRAGNDAAATPLAGAADAAKTATRDALPTATDDDTSGMFWLVGAGGAVLAVALLLFRRRGATA